MRALAHSNFRSALLGALALAASACSPAATTPDIRLASIGDEAEVVSLSQFRGRAHVVMFWRSDCTPCLIELRSHRALEAAAQGALITVALEPESSARGALERFGAPQAQAYVVDGDAQAALEAVSGGGRRLPYAIALDARGRICARHVGLLGTDTARAWIRQCS